MTTLQRREHNPIAHLTDDDIENLGRELDAIRQHVLDSRGERDAEVISLFGTQAMTLQYRCRRCGTLFEAIKYD